MGVRRFNFLFVDHPPGMSMAAPYTAAGAAVHHSPHGRQLKLLYYESMTDEIRSGFYDEFAAYYHLMFEDWEASMARQAAARSLGTRAGAARASTFSTALVESARSRSGWQSSVTKSRARISAPEPYGARVWKRQCAV